MKKILLLVFIAYRGIVGVSIQDEILYNPNNAKKVVFIADLHVNRPLLSAQQATAIKNLIDITSPNVTITETTHIPFKRWKHFSNSIDFQKKPIAIKNYSIKNLLDAYLTDLQDQKVLQIEPNTQLLYKLHNLAADGLLFDKELNNSRLEFYARIEFFISIINRVPLSIITGKKLDDIYTKYILESFDENMTLQDFFRQIDLSISEAIENLKFLEQFEKETIHRANPLIAPDLERVEDLRRKLIQATKYLTAIFSPIFTIRDLRERAIQIFSNLVSSSTKNYISVDELFDDFYRNLFGNTEVMALLNDIKELLGLVHVSDLPKQSYAFSLSLFDLAALKEIIKSPQHTIIVIAGFYHCMGMSRYLRQNGWCRVQKSSIYVDYPELPKTQFENGNELIQEIIKFTDAKITEYKKRHPNDWQSEINKISKQIFNSVHPLSKKEIISLAKKINQR